MKKNITIHEGFTNNYLIPGALAVILSLISIIWFGVYAIIPLLFSFALVSGSNGLEIDLNQNKYRKYGSFFSLKVGTWETFDTPTFARLSISSENSVAGGVPGMAGFIVPNQGKLKSITYDVYIETKTGRTIRLYDFLEYKNAKKALREIETSLEIDVLDKVREKLIENRERRNSRR